MTLSTTVAPCALDELCINTLRFLAVDMVQQANSGHPGLPLGAAARADTRWGSFHNGNPSDPPWPDRARSVPSPVPRCPPPTPHYPPPLTVALPLCIRIGPRQLVQVRRRVAAEHARVSMILLQYIDHMVRRRNLSRRRQEEDEECQKRRPVKLHGSPPNSARPYY